MKKPSNLNYTAINQELSQYLFADYDLHFIHGWFCSYLSSPSDSEEDLVLPSYLVFDETKINDEDKFNKTIDKAINVYSVIADSIYDNNKLIKPLINLAKPNSFEVNKLTDIEKRNLLMWLYGYLTCHVLINEEMPEDEEFEELLDSKFYPAFFALCAAFIKLHRELDALQFHDNEVKQDIVQLVEDLANLWEASEEDELSEKELLENEIANYNYNNLLENLNDIFYVIRVMDEKKFAKESIENNPIAKKLKQKK